MTLKSVGLKGSLKTQQAPAAKDETGVILVGLILLVSSFFIFMKGKTRATEPV